jgi:hypothetical protein
MTLPPVSRLALTLKSSFSLAHLFFNGLLAEGAPEPRPDSLFPAQNGATNDS